jgi:hypothetical protein
MASPTVEELRQMAQALEEVADAADRALEKVSELLEYVPPKNPKSD